MSQRKFLDVYSDSEMRQLYAEMFPALLFDEDCWFPFGEVGGQRLLFDATLSLAQKDPDAEHFAFYSKKGEERIRAVQAKCKFHKRTFIDDVKQQPPSRHSDLPITVGLTRGSHKFEVPE